MNACLPTLQPPVGMGSHVGANDRGVEGKLVLSTAHQPPTQAHGPGAFLLRLQKLVVEGPPPAPTHPLAHPFLPHSRVHLLQLRHLPEALAGAEGVTVDGGAGPQLPPQPIPSLPSTVTLLGRLPRSEPGARLSRFGPSGLFELRPQFPHLYNGTRASATLSVGVRIRDNAHKGLVAQQERVRSTDIHDHHHHHL